MFVSHFPDCFVRQSRKDLSVWKTINSCYLSKVSANAFYMFVFYIKHSNFVFYNYCVLYKTHTYKMRLQILCFNNVFYIKHSNFAAFENMLVDGIFYRYRRCVVSLRKNSVYKGTRTVVVLKKNVL